MLLVGLGLLLVGLRPVFARGLDWRRRLGQEANPHLEEENP
jgi:hypothetical protein